MAFFDRAMRRVRGYHGTLIDRAEAVAKGSFQMGTREGRWLGAGLYFFEENYELARSYAERQQIKHEKPGAVLKVEIDLARCLDMTTPFHQNLVRQTHDLMVQEALHDGPAPPEQKALELHKGMVRSGYAGEWADYGTNNLDYAVVERAIQHASDKEGITFDTVRGMFIEHGPIYPSSWLYSGAHCAIAVRNLKRIANPIVLPIE